MLGVGLGLGGSDEARTRPPGSERSACRPAAPRMSGKTQQGVCSHFKELAAPVLESSLNPFGAKNIWFRFSKRPSAFQSEDLKDERTGAKAERTAPGDPQCNGLLHRDPCDS